MPWPGRSGRVAGGRRRCRSEREQAPVGCVPAPVPDDDELRRHGRHGFGLAHVHVADGREGPRLHREHASGNGRRDGSVDGRGVAGARVCRPQIPNRYQTPVRPGAGDRRRNHEVVIGAGHGRRWRRVGPSGGTRRRRRVDRYLRQRRRGDDGDGDGEVSILLIGPCFLSTTRARSGAALPPRRRRP